MGWIVVLVIVLVIVGVAIWAGSGGENEIKARDNRDVLGGGGHSG